MTSRLTVCLAVLAVSGVSAAQARLLGPRETQGGPVEVCQARPGDVTPELQASRARAGRMAAGGRAYVTAGLGRHGRR